MTFAHALAAMQAIAWREITRFVQQRARLLSALVRPLLWLAVFAAGFRDVFGVSIIPPYDTYITYQEYVLPGLVGMVLLFQGMQSSLSMVYDREMGAMRLLLTAPLPRGYVLLCKLLAGTLLSILQAIAFLAVAALLDVHFSSAGWVTMLPALVIGGFMLGAVGLLLSVYIRQLENFAGAMNFVIFPMFFLSPALYPLWRLQESAADVIYWLALINPFTYVVELLRFAMYGELNATALAVVGACAIVFYAIAIIGYTPGQLLKTRARG